MEKVFEYYKLDENTKSITPYADVFTSMIDNQKVVIKRTKDDPEEIAGLVAWGNKLEENHIKVVHPVAYEGQLYKTIEGENWVIYPFIEGRNYDGSPEDLYQAGKLLGKIHALSSEESVLQGGFNWDDYVGLNEDDFFNEVSDELRDISEIHDTIIRTKAYKKLHHQIMTMIEQKFQSIRSKELPMVDGTWDFKANSLAFVNDDIILMDMDHGGRIPRILDLALALILFHNEMEGIPPNVFTLNQWEQFKKGYFEHVTLTDMEKQVWQDFVLFAYIDEALLVLSDFNIESSERQIAFLEDLLKFDIEKYTL